MTPVTRFLSIMSESFDKSDVDSKIAAFDELKHQVTKSDLPELTTAICSASIDFWTRELLAEPVAELGGAASLPVLLAAFQQNLNDGHDNDTFRSTLTDLTWTDSAACRSVLARLSQADDGDVRRHANWLMDFCD